MVETGARRRADPQRRDLAAALLFASEGKSSPSIERPDPIADSVSIGFPDSRRSSPTATGR